MKKMLLTLSAICALSSAVLAQSTIAYWDQNSNSHTTGFGFTTASFPQSADQGTGTITLGNFNAAITNNGTEDVYNFIQSFGGTTTNALPTITSGGSLSPQGGEDLGSGPTNNGMNIDINVSTVGLSGISVSWAQRGTSSGFTIREFSYSSDGGSIFTVAGTDSGVLTSTWTTASYDLSAVTALDDNASVVFRIVLDGATGATGNNRFDNILVTAAVPEPSTYAAILGLLALGFVAYRRRK